MVYSNTPNIFLFSYSLKTGEMVATLSILLSIIRIWYGVIRIYLSYILYLNKKRGFGVATCISTFVPILYHIYKHLSTNLNTYFKIIFYLLTHKRRGKWCIPIILFSYSLKIRDFLMTVFSPYSSHLNQ